MVDPHDDEAGSAMLLAASYAGMGNAGVHLPHGMFGPVSGMARQYRPAGYEVPWPIVPHGMSVILNPPAVFRFPGPAAPQRHMQAAEWLGADVRRAHPKDAGDILAERVTHFMQQLGMPNGLKAVGYTSEDIPALVEGPSPQHRVTKVSPRPASVGDLAGLFEDAMVAW